MCRLFVATAADPLDPARYLEAFAEACRVSREYQGHGFGVAWRTPAGWDGERSVAPIWETPLPRVPPTRLVIAHARSAFRDEGIAVEHNMPFLAGDLAFAFNGELRGVRVRAPGANGAHRLFHLLQRFVDTTGDVPAALARLDGMIHQRSEYVRALNLVVGDGERVWINNRFSEDPEYFRMHTATLGSVALASSDAWGAPGLKPAWQPVVDDTVFELTKPALCSS